MIDAFKPPLMKNGSNKRKIFLYNGVENYTLLLRTCQEKRDNRRKLGNTIRPVE